MNKIVLIEIRSNYGKEAIYPANKEAELFADIAGTKTITRDALKSIKELGYLIEVKPLEF